ncbi:serine/threonine-protein kinase [Mesoterricola sediminis]|uniref:serine/threonine-protein kinase n=1 Tax=Mesoterricola sediminis TaxID=2927980 RepID=UPI001FAECFAC|nr:serine/threonine-protein kinase [Mesoterricola sediminis]
MKRAIGQGAMGVVYLAEDPLLKRRLAIKVVRATGEERDQALERFKREAEISAQLNHPNIVTVYDVGEEPSIGPFIAMEYVEGNSLGRFIRDASLDLETRFGILIQTMRALRAAHRNAIVHRDVKPDNILVAEDGRVKLMDFGIAKTMAPRLTNAGEFLGSPAYSAPELLRGGDPTPASDRYAFAVTAFELLTGQLPHPGGNVAAVITHILTEPPVFPAGMSGDIAKVFRQALAQDPDERQATLMDFLLPLVDAHPLDPVARQRVDELFRHDDHAGDIVPLRRLRPGVPTPEPPAGASSSGWSGSHTLPGARATPARPVPSYTQPSPVKIELETASPTATRPPGWEEARKRRKPQSSLTAWTLVKWFIAILVAGQLCWWAWSFLQANINAAPR